MGWSLLLWSLKLLITILNILESFKSLKPIKTRVKRAKTIENELKNGGGSSLTSSERSRRRNLKSQLIVWLVWIAFVGVERISDKFISWLIPFYDELKVISLIFILTCRSAGAELVFKKIIKPLISPYESSIDSLAYLANGILNLLVGVIILIPTIIKKKWDDNRAISSEEIPSIMIALREPSRPKLSHQLADTIEELSQQQPSKSTKSKTAPITVEAEIVPVPITHPRRAPASVASANSRIGLSKSTTVNGSNSRNLTSRLNSETTTRVQPSTSNSLLSRSTSSRLPLVSTSSSFTVSSSSRSTLQPSIPILKNSNLESELKNVSNIPTPFNQFEFHEIQQQEEQQEQYQMPPPVQSLKTSLRKSATSNKLSPVVTPLPPPSVPSSIIQPPISPPKSHTSPSHNNHIPILIEPPTPAPPGAFTSSISRSTSNSISSSSSKPLRNPILDSLSDEISTKKEFMVPSSPRDKASLAIRNLGKDLDSIEDESELEFGLSRFGSGKKRGRKVSNDSLLGEGEVVEGSDKKVVKKSKKMVELMKGKNNGEKSKGKKSNEDKDDYLDDEDEEEEDKGNNSTSTTTSKKSIASTSTKRSRSPVVTKKLAITKPRTIRPTASTSNLKRKLTTAKVDSSSDVEISLPVSSISNKTNKSKVVNSLKPRVVSSSQSSLNLSTSSRVGSEGLRTSTSRLNLSNSTSSSKTSLSTSQTSNRNPLSLSTTSSNSSNNSNSTIRPPAASRTALSNSTSSRGLVNSATESQGEKEKVELAKPIRKKPRRVLLGTNTVRNFDEGGSDEEGMGIGGRRR